MKITHMVTIKLNYDKSDPRMDKFLSESKTILSSIPGVENFKIFRQTSQKNIYDFGFSMDFKDRETYQKYLNHPIHTDYVKQIWQKEVADFQEIDIEDL